MTETPQETQVFKSKWGYHPCDQKTYFKLRKLNAIFFKAQQKAATWHRWNRKDPKNRKGKEPKICKIFSVISSTEPYIEPFGAFYNGYWGQRTEHSYWIKKKREDRAVWDGNKDTYPNAERYRYVPCKEKRFIDVDSLGIDRAYRNAKIPQRQEDVIPLNISEKEIDSIYCLCFPE